MPLPEWKTQTSIDGKVATITVTQAAIDQPMKDTSEESQAYRVRCEEMHRPQDYQSVSKVAYVSASIIGQCKCRHAEAHIVALDLFTAKKYYVADPADTESLDAPNVDRRFILHCAMSCRTTVHMMSGHRSVSTRRAELAHVAGDAARSLALTFR